MDASTRGNTRPQASARPASSARLARPATPRTTTAGLDPGDALVHAPAPGPPKGAPFLLQDTSFAMGYGDNRRTPKMTRKKRQTKLQLRIKRRALEVRAARQSKNPQQAAEPAKKSKAKKEKAPKAAQA